MAEFESRVEAIIDVTRPAFEGIEDFNLKQVGDLGELVARTFLEDNGYEILDTNWKTPFGEADIIAKDGQKVTFAEVKTRRLLGFTADEINKVAPEEAVDLKKFERYAKMAEYYKLIGEDPGTIRFDVIAITFLSNRIAHIAHLIGAFWWGD